MKKTDVQHWYPNGDDSSFTFSEPEDLALEHEIHESSKGNYKFFCGNGKTDLNS